MPEYLVQESEAGERIDVVLSRQVEASRSQIQKLIKNKEILLNQEAETPHVLVKAGDVISYPTVLVPPLVAKGPAPKLDILFEDEDLLVIEKPAGLLVHQSTVYDAEPTVVDGLRALFPNIATVGDDPTRPGIVHRLDKDVSGLLVIAKTQDMFENLKTQFKERQTKKVYLALAYGVLENDQGEIRLRIARSKTRGRMVARPESQEGKEAITNYEVLERFKIATYLRVHILTGRTHQIRAHFKAIDHPLVGDKLYAKKAMKNIRPIDLNRIFLHAHELTIRLASGEEKTFVSALPADLERVLSELPKH